MALTFPQAPTYLYDRKEVAELIGASVITVIRWADSGKLLETRIPSARGHRALPRYTQAAIQAFFDSGYLRVPRRARASSTH